MMDLQLLANTAVLAVPTIASQYESAQLTVVDSVQSRSILFPRVFFHEAHFNDSRNDFCCSSERNRKSRDIDISSTSGLPWSRLAPARKSAQIISRQYPRDLSVPSISPAVSIACSTTGI